MEPARRIAVPVIVFATIVACGSSGDRHEPNEATRGPTFHRDVAPILKAKCQACHSAGGAAPFSLTTYAEVAPLAPSIVTETQARRMPPWGALETDECKTPRRFRDDLHLTNADLATLATWQAAGAPEGDPKAAPPPFEPRNRELAGADRDLRIVPYRVEGHHDRYRCFVLDPAFADDTYLDGVQVVPGNTGIVHHALLYTDPRRESPTHVDADGGYDCFGGPNLGETSILSAWVPGADALETGDDVAVKVAKGSLLVLQIHYHPHPSQEGADRVDASRIQLRFASHRPAFRIEMVLVGNFANASGGLLAGPGDDGRVEFRIPAESQGHTEQMLYTFRDLPLDQLSIYGVGHHMHYLGKDMKTEIVHASGEPKTECLLQTPQWDFNWQRFYRYDATLDDLPKIRKGDTLRLRCSYDNSTKNPKLRESLREQGLSAPVDVSLGEATLDEMCLVGLALLGPNL